MKPAPGRVLAASAALGGGLFVLLAASGALADVALLLTLAPLILVPVALDLVATPTRDGHHAAPYRAAVAVQPLAALCATAALLLPRGVVAGAFAATWALATGLVALFGLWRLLPRGRRPVEELLIDAGLLYLPVGGVGLLLHRLGIAPLGFGDALVLLAGIHFHYAGFVLPVLVGLSGRTRVRAAWLPYTPLAAVVGIGPGLIGLGITFSPLVEVVSVGFFTVAVALLAVRWLVAVVPSRDDRRQRIALAVSALVLPASMVLALLFGVSRFVGRPIAGVRIPTMISLHGHLNALGFALFGILGWRLAVPESRVPAPGFPVSALAARSRIGGDYLERTGTAGDGAPAGQVDDLSVYARPDFDPDAVHPDVRRFYERTGGYELAYEVTWHRGFRTGARLVAPLVSAVGQLALPRPGAGVRRTHSHVVAVDDGADGRSDVRGWIRRDREAGHAVFVAAYATHERGDETVTNVALPLPGGNLTAVLRMDALDAGGGSTGVELASTPRTSGGDPGVYFVTPAVPVRLPVRERFRVWPVNAPDAPDVEFSTAETLLVARHEMWLFGRQFLTIEYAIEPAPDA